MIVSTNIKTIRILHFESPISHTEPILKALNQLKLSDMYTMPPS